MKLLQMLACKLGMHGPNFLGSESQPRSYRSDGLERTCECCGKKWHGYMTSNAYMRFAVWSPVRADGTSIDPR